MFKATVNNASYDIEQKGNALWINNEVFEFDIIETEPHAFHVIYNNVGHKIYIIEVDKEEKTVTILINNKPAIIAIQDKMDLLLQKMGIESNTSKKGGIVKAPMPGLVLSIKVEVGQEIKKGDPLLILEAMKMENVLKATSDGTVKSINIEQGVAVEKNEVLIELS